MPMLSPLEAADSPIDAAEGLGRSAEGRALAARAVLASVPVSALIWLILIIYFFRR